MSYKLNKLEEKNLQEIKKAYYMTPVIKRLDACMDETNQKSCAEAFNKVYRILLDSEADVREIIQKRKASGKISNVDQAIKSVVSNIFPRCIIYLFLKNKLVGNIRLNIFITSKPKQVKGFEDISVINIGTSDTQKPDCDLIIYAYKPSEDGEEQLKKCIILSLKTSMRERAAQTYKWKLLLEIANDQHSAVREKYDISYEVKETPLICFVTVNPTFR